MRKLLAFLCFLTFLLTACSRKTHPTVSAEKPAHLPGSPMIIVDGSGTIITSKDKLPADIAAKTNYTTLARAYTPDQKRNLIFRFKMLPPKVLYVPDVYISKSAKGKYIVYRKKFWYWQKADGLFYLDETYYH